MKTRSSSRRSSEAGQVLVLFALFGFVLMGALALALDVGFLLSERRGAQAAADAAALAGARALLAGESSTSVKGAAQSYATVNGLPTANADLTVNVQGDRRDGRVAVDLTMPVQRFFLGAIYTGPWEVGARAVAEIDERADANYVLIALREPGIYVNGSMQVTVNNGSLMSNDIILASGGANVIKSDGFIDAHKIITASGDWEAPYGIREGRAKADDPFADYARPSRPTGPPITGNIKCMGTQDEGFYDGDPDWEAAGECSQLRPGWYRNANIRIHTTVNLPSGLYYFENTKLELRSSNAEIIGTGVNFYFTGNPSRAKFEPNNGSVNLTAPGWHPDDDELTVHGDHRDIVVWIDVCPNGPTFDASGGQRSFLGGAVYAPCSNVLLHGNPSGETLNGMLVAASITMKGSSNIAITHRSYAPTVSYEIYLVE